MAIKTELERRDLDAVCVDWGLGRLMSFRGLPEGSINTLYALETERGRFVLRLSEGRTEAEVRFETGLLRYLKSARFPAAVLVPRTGGEAFGVVRERFAVVFVWGAGEHAVARVWTEAMAMDAGRVLGRLHVQAESFSGRLQNRYGVVPVRVLASDVVSRASDEALARDADLQAFMPVLRHEVSLLDALPAANEGVIHADFFPDNLLFLGERVSAVLDFEMACVGPYVLDLATAIHACGYDDGYVQPRVRAMVAGYLSERPLPEAEQSVFHAWARFSALRFTVTRILDFHLAPLDPDKLAKKDWRRFRDRLSATVAMGDEGWRDLCGL